MTDNPPCDPSLWTPPVTGFEELTDITYHQHVLEGVPQPTVRVAFNRPRCATHFVRTPLTSSTERSITRGCRRTSGVVLLTGNGPSPKDGGWAFCSGGDQRIRGRSGYQYAEGGDGRHR